MTASRKTTLGLFAEGPVGEAVMTVLLDRCPDRLAYVVAPARDSRVAERHGALGAAAPLLFWSDEDAQAQLPRHLGEAPEVVLLAWWPLLVGRAFLSAGQAATLNMHPSLLPYGRGKDPNFWALADGEPFGVTIHHVDEGVDTGDIAFQSPLATGWDDTGATLYARAQDGLIELFSGSLDAILALDIPRTPQGAGGTAHRRAELEPRSTLDLDSTMTVRALLNLLRARTFTPHPGCGFSDASGAYQVRVQIEKLGD